MDSPPFYITILGKQEEKYFWVFLLKMTKVLLTQYQEWGLTIVGQLHLNLILLG